MVDSHKVWLIAGITFAILIVGFLVLYPNSGDGFVGEAKKGLSGSSSSRFSSLSSARALSETEIATLSKDDFNEALDLAVNSGRNEILDDLSGNGLVTVEARDQAKLIGKGLGKKSVTDLFGVSTNGDIKSNIEAKARVGYVTEAARDQAVGVVQSQLDSATNALTVGGATNIKATQLQGKLSDKILAFNSLQGNYNSALGTIATRDSTITNLESDKVILQNDLSDSVVTISDLQQSLADNEVSIEAITNLQTQLSDVTGQRDDEIENYNNLNLNFNSVSSQLETKTSALATANDNLVVQTGLVNQLQGTVDSLNLQLDTKQDLLNTKTSLLSSANGALQNGGASNTFANGLSNTIVGLNSDISNLNLQVEGLTDSLANAAIDTSVLEGLQADVISKDLTIGTLGTALISGGDSNTYATGIQSALDALQTDYNSATAALTDGGASNTFATGLQIQVNSLNDQIGNMITADDLNTEKTNSNEEGQMSVLTNFAEMFDIATDDLGFSSLNSAVVDAINNAGSISVETSADIDDDGKVSLSDAVEILRCYYGVETSYTGCTPQE